MAGSTKTDIRTNVYSEEGKKESRLGEPNNGSYIIGPGLDQFYEFIYRYGLPILLFTSVILFFWFMWSIDFSGSKFK